MEEGISLGGPDQSANPSDVGEGVSLGSDAPTTEPAASGGDTWGAALNEDNRALVENKGWQSPDDALKSYRELDEYRGRSVALPGEEATDEDWKSFRQKMGVPEAADAYELAAIEGADEASVNSLKELFHGAGLDQRQAEAMYQNLTEAYAGSEQAAKTAQAEQVIQAKSDAKAALAREWGNENGEDFKRNTEAARRAVNELGGDALFEELRQLGAITEDNQILSPVIAKAFAEVGNQLFVEDGLIEGGDAIAVNPFANDTINLTAQGELVKTNPSLARAQIRAANKRPEDYGLPSN